jgi:outer membrane protein TolC
MKKGLIFLLFILPLFSIAQVPLTLNSAIDTALQNNFDVQIAKNNLEINKISNTFGNAGGMPSISGSLGGNSSFSQGHLEQKLNTGTERIYDNVLTKSITSGVTASMYLFNGFQIRATKSKLDYLQKQSISNLNRQLQNTIAAVMVMYYDILRQQNYQKIIQSSIDVSSNKLEIIKNRLNVGMANEADLLQAQMDLNSAEQDLKAQHLVIEQAKTNLLELMGVKHFFDISIKDTIIIDKLIQKEFVMNFLEQNPDYVSADQQIKINEQIVKERKALRYPSVRINTGYNYSYTSSSAGLNLFTKNYAPTLGATVQIPVFNGNISKIQQKVASLNVKNARVEKQNVLTSLKADAVKTYDSYKSTLEQIDSQKISYQNSVKLVNIIIQRFRLNQATILDVKAAQASFEAAGNTLANLQYSAKISEIELRRLMSDLGK